MDDDRDLVTAIGVSILGSIVALLVLTLILGLVEAARCRSAHAHDASDPNAAWFQSLMRPDLEGSCCSGPDRPHPDCLPVQSRQTPEGYEALIDDRFPHGPGEPQPPGWIKVPPAKVLQHSPNPTGSAVACWLPNMGLLCFVRPAET